MIEEEKPQEIVNIGIKCSKHGQLFQDAIISKVFHTLSNEDGKVYEHREIYCLACLTEMYSKSINSGESGTLEPYEIEESNTEATEKVDEQDVK